MTYVHTGWRRVLNVTGTDSTSFLHSLLTVDVLALRDAKSQWGYGLFLTPQGRCGTDVFLIWHRDAWWIDCYAPHVPYILQVLKRYKLRSDVQWQEDVSLSSAFLPQVNQEVTGYTAKIQGAHPRGFPGGQRVLMEKTPDRGVSIGCFAQYKRYNLDMTVPLTEYTVLPWGTLFPLAFHMEYGINFSKGCYIGQERTALTYYRGVIKYHLKCSTGSGPERGAVYHHTSKVGRIMYGVQGRYLVLVKKDVEANTLYTLPQGNGRVFSML